MNPTSVRDLLERQQVVIYFAAVLFGASVALFWPQSASLEPLINPALALMLFATFLLVPLSRLGKSFADVRFLAALLAANFIAIPVLVATLLQLLPAEPLLMLGVAFVLLTPCVDYVVTFSHLGRADAHALLAATPLLLLAQMLLLPVYLGLLIGPAAAGLVTPGPFLHAFVTLILTPLLLAALAQVIARHGGGAEKAVAALGTLAVPATAFVLFIVICAVVPQLGLAIESVREALPLYVLFAVLAPVVGWLVARAGMLSSEQARAVAFSAATRNSLVILPLALAVPGAVPIIPAVIVAQTLVELISELIYIRVLPRFK